VDERGLDQKEVEVENVRVSILAAIADVAGTLSADERFKLAQCLIEPIHICRIGGYPKTETGMSAAARAGGKQACPDAMLRHSLLQRGGTRVR
jgi:hypothetical protein